MKYLWMIIGFLLLCVPVLAEDFIVTEAEYVVISGNVSDTLGRTRLTPDSMRIVVTDSAGTELFDAWFEAADAQCALNGDVITFFDQWEDINGAADIGVYSIMTTIASDAQNNVDLFSNYNYTLRGVTVGVEQTFNEVGDILDTLQNQDDWVGTTAKQTLIIDTVNGIMDTLQSQDGWVAKEASLFDPATDSVIVDGSSLAATTDAITAATMAVSAVDEIVDSTWDEVLTGATHNIATSAGRKLRDVSQVIILEGTAQRGNSLGIVLASATSFADNILNGNIVSITGGTGEGQSKHIHDFTGATDSITLHAGDEWATNPDATSEYVIEPAAKTSVAHITDSAKVDIADGVWDEPVSGHAVALSYGDTIPKMLEKIGDTVNANNAYFDTLIYQGGVWVDAGANTNTVVGVDGTPKNPVGTIAAAKTIADALGFATIFFLDGANETIAATMEHYKFTGITRNATVNLGSQDVDGSFFENLMLTGQQGGTGLISVINAGLSALDSLEIHARNCAILGPISLRGGDKTNHFDKCYSSVAGSGTPILNFNDASDSIYVNWRAYSGGLELQNMTTNHVMSYESDGQLVINANCDNGVISARGMMTITDNGTTMSITKDAVFSRAEADQWVWANADTTLVDSSEIGTWLSTGISASISAANMAQIADSVWGADTAGADVIATGMGNYILDSLQAALDLLQGTLDVNMTQVSGDATAADNLETMLDSTGGKPLTVSQIVMEAAGNNTALVATGFGNGNGAAFSSGSGAGSGAVFSGSPGSGDGLRLVANSGDALVYSSASGADMNGEFVAANFAVSAIGRIADTVFQNDTISAYAGGAGTIGVAIRDSAYNSGPAASISAADIVAITDSVWKRSWAYAYTAGSIGDSLTTSAYVQGTASGLTKEAVADAVADTMEAGTRQINYRSLAVDSGTVLAASETGVGLTVTGGATSGVGFEVSTTAGNAAYWHASGGNFNGLRIEGAGNGHGISALGGTTSGGSGIRAQGGTGGGYGVHFIGINQFHGLFTQGGDSADGANTAGHGAVAQGGAGVGAADNQGGYGWVGLGGGAAGTYAGHGFYGIGGGHGSGFQGVGGNLLGAGFNGLGGSTGGYGFGITSAAGNYAALFVNAHGTGRDFDGIYDTGNYSLAWYDSIAGTIDDSLSAVHGAGSWAISGTGIDTLQIRAHDTSSATDIANVTIIAVSPGNAVVAMGLTDANGLVLFELDAGVTYSITGTGPNFQQWNNPTSITNTAGYNPAADTILGWSISTAVPAATKTAAVLVILKDASGAAAEGVNVSAYLIRSNLTDSSGAGVVNIPQNQKTDATGVATFTCRWSSYLIPATKWRFQAHVPGSGGIRKDYTVPRVTVDTLNLAD